MKPSELCDKAAELIEEGGWAQGKYISPDGYCLVGALRHIAHGAVNDTPFDSSAWEILGIARLAVSNQIPEPERSENQLISTWNDKPERTKDEVLTLLRQTAETLREQETPDETV